MDTVASINAHIRLLEIIKDSKNESCAEIMKSIQLYKESSARICKSLIRMFIELESKDCVDCGKLLFHINEMKDDNVQIKLLITELEIELKLIERGIFDMEIEIEDLMHKASEIE